MRCIKTIIALINCLIIALTSCYDTNLPCDQDCLIGFIDQYLEALVAHDPMSLPLSKDVQYTENGQTLELGDGMWGPANAVRDYKLYFVDTTNSQAAIFCMVEENGHPEIVAMRLKIDHNKISEIEKIVARIEPDKWCKPESLVEKPINKMSAGEQFATGFSTFITRIRERRFPVVDEVRGLIFGFPMFVHLGDVQSIKIIGIPGVDTIPKKFPPFNLQAGEIFKISGGQIHEIEANGTVVPYGAGSGWDD